MRIIVDDGGSNDIYDENIILYGFYFESNLLQYSLNRALHKLVD